MPNGRKNAFQLGAFFVVVYGIAAYFSAEIRLLLAVLVGVAVLVLFVSPMLTPVLRAPQARGFYVGAVIVATIGLFVADYDRSASIFFWTAAAIYFFASESPSDREKERS